MKMKSTYIVLTAFFIFSFNLLAAQKSARTANYENLYGKWYYESSKTTDDLLVFVKKQDNYIRFGYYIIINSNQELIVGRSAQCGNDQSIFRNYGTWEIDLKKDSIMTDIDILKRGTNFKIIKLTTVELILK